MQNATARQLHRHSSWLRWIAIGTASFVWFSPTVLAAPQESQVPSLNQSLGAPQPSTEIDPSTTSIPGPESQSVGKPETAASSNTRQADAVATAPEELRFSFERAPWREVINWLASACDLALQYQELPSGSFSYSDPRSYTPEEAISRINLFLLPQGFTIVRSNQLMSVIELNDPRSLQQLDALAELVSPEELSQRPKHEVVKCLFSLGPLDTGVATEELSVIKLMTQPLVFTKTRQLMITDTVEKLLQVQRILEAFQQPTAMEEGMRMASFPLEHITAEDVLLVARPHLGLATGEMIGIDVSISTDLQGEHIFVTGLEDKVKLIESMVKALDQPAATMTFDSGNNELRSHLVTGGNLDMVYDVLKTLLAGKSLRLSADQATSSIVALATPDVQKEIAATVAQLQAQEADFEVIQLRASDPYQIISLLEEMLDLPDEYAEPDEIPVDTPKIDADPLNRRLFVRAKPHKIEQIKKIVEGLDQADSDSSQGLRILPLQGKQAEEVLEAARKFWREQTPVVVLPAADEAAQPEVIERIPNEDQEAIGQEIQISARVNRSLPSAQGDDNHSIDEEVVDSDDESPDACADRKPILDAETSEQVHSPTAFSSAAFSNTALVGFEGTPRDDETLTAIRCQFTPQGLVIESRDIEALERFEQHLRAIAGPMRNSASPPTVFYLQYTKPNDALRLLAELLDGGESAKEADAGQLVRGYVSSHGSFLGSIVTSRDGTLTMMAGTITVVADTRLNRLIAQGTSPDIRRIESYLKIIDKDSSIADIKTNGISRIIELKYSAASEVAAVVREAFASRVESGSSRGNPGMQGGDGRGGEGRGADGRDWQRPDDNDRNRDDDNRGEGDRGQPRGSSGGAAVPDLEPKMTVAVHEPSNSLIITAPEQLIAQVEDLVKLIDTRSEEVVEVLAPENAAYIQSALQPNSVDRRNNNSQNRNGNNRSSGGNNRNRNQNSRVMELLRGR